jgi:hypothetical protein
MNNVMPAPSNIKDYYYKKWDNFYCCYQSDYHNLGAAWPAFGGIHAHITTDTLVVPYDAIKFKAEYSDFSLHQHLEYARQSKMFVIIDKTVEHVHSEQDFAELYSNLKQFDLLDRCVVFDNTADETLFTKYNVPHVYGPYYVWFYIFFKRIPNFVADPVYQFLCLNNYDKPHRLATIILLHQKNFIKRTLWSYRAKIFSSDSVDQIIPDFDLSMVNFTLPHFVDQQNDNFNQELNIENLHAQSMCSIVTETDYLFDKTKFATEKSWNSIFYGTLPIIISCPGTVSLMREHGIDVYDDIIDHSYDEIADPVQRFQQISHVVEQCASWRDYKQMMSLTATRQLRNQMLLTHDDHWIKEIDSHAIKFFGKNKISI